MQRTITTGERLNRAVAQFHDDRAAGKNPDWNAFVADDVRVAAGAALTDLDQFANHLRERGLRPSVVK
jgi:hypothetical protein